MSGDISRKLGITVEATDKASGKLSHVKSEVAGIQGAAAMSGSRFGSFVGGIERGASRMKSAIGNAASHAKAQLSGIAGAGLGLLGVGGLFGIGAVISKSIGKAAEFGGTVAKVASITGLATKTASAMVDTLEKWGISTDKMLPLLGKLEKNVGTVGGSAKKAAAFQKAYSFSLVDSKGHLADANTLLLRSADYFTNKNIPATQKAVVMAKLWGKSWQDLIPILAKGSAGIKEQEKNSIQLTDTQLANITKYRTASRDFQDIIGDLEVKIGANLMPKITEVLRSVGTWVDTHADDIATFFGNAADMAGKVAGAAADVFGGIKRGWDSIPGPLRDLLLKGLVADRAFKFLFGFSPASLVVKLGGDLVGGIAGAVGRGLVTMGIGKAFVQPVFVTNKNFGLPGGGGSGESLPSKAAKGLGLGIPSLATLGAFGAAMAIGFIPVFAAGIVMNMITPEERARQQEAARRATIIARGGDPSHAPTGVRGAPRSSVPSSQWGARPGRDAPTPSERAEVRDLKRSGPAPRDAPTAGDRAAVAAALRTKAAVDSARIEQIAAIRAGDRSITGMLRPLRSGIDQAKTAISDGKRAQVAAIDRDKTAVVAAIHGIRLVNHNSVTIPISIMGIPGRQTVRVSQTGTTLTRAQRLLGGKIVPI